MLLIAFASAHTRAPFLRRKGDTKQYALDTSSTNVDIRRLLTISFKVFTSTLNKHPEIVRFQSGAMRKGDILLDLLPSQSVLDVLHGASRAKLRLSLFIQRAESFSHSSFAIREMPSTACRNCEMFAGDTIQCLYHRQAQAACLSS